MFKNECSRILRKYLSYDSENEKIAKKALKEFLYLYPEAKKFVTSYYSISGLIVTKERLYSSEYIDNFLGILQKYNYNMKLEIIHALGYLCLQNKKDLIEKYSKSPVIQDISFNGNECTVYSEKYGCFVAHLATHYFRNNDKISAYFEQAGLHNNCHFHTRLLSNVFPEMYSITALCRKMFEGQIIHSFTYDAAKDVIIDLNFNAVFDRTTYYKLFEPENISIIRNCNIKKELEITESKTKQKRNMSPLLKIALYKKYLDDINYVGELENAPSLRK